MISGETTINSFALTSLISETIFDDDPLVLENRLWYLDIKLNIFNITSIQLFADNTCNWVVF